MSFNKTTTTYKYQYTTSTYRYQYTTSTYRYQYTTSTYRYQYTTSTQPVPTGTSTQPVPVHNQYLQVPVHNQYLQVPVHNQYLQVPVHNQCLSKLRIVNFVLFLDEMYSTEVFMIKFVSDLRKETWLRLSGIKHQCEWVIVVWCQFRNFSAILWWEQFNFQWDDDEVHFVLDQHAKLDFYSASSLKQQSVGRHVAPLWHIILIPSQPVFALSP